MKFDRTILCALALGCASIPSSLLAADLPSAEVPPVYMAATAYNWSGAYFGGQIGYGWSGIATGTTHMYEDTAGLVEDIVDGPIPGFSYSGSGLIGGVEAGYNWQGNTFVVGVVADLSAANVHGSFTDSSNFFTVDSTIDWLSTARLNIGVPMGNVLFYATGGAAMGGLTARLRDDYGVDGIQDSSDKTTNFGWTIGAGVAAPISNNWIIKAEYLYVDLGSQDVSFSEVNPPGFGLITSSARTTANLLRVSLDYKF